VNLLVGENPVGGGGVEWLRMFAAPVCEDDVIIAGGLSKITGAGQDCREAEEYGLFCNDFPSAV